MVHDCSVSDPGRGVPMAAMKPRTGDGPLEVTKEGRGIVMRVPLEGGGRLVVELTAQEASDLGDALKAASGCRRSSGSDGRFTCWWGGRRTSATPAPRQPLLALRRSPAADGPVGAGGQPIRS